MKLPPHDTDAEKSLIGAMLLKNAIWHDASGIVRSSDFYTHDHRTIWHGIADMMRANEPADLITLTAYLRDLGKLNEAGGFPYIGGIVADTASAANARQYAERIRELSNRRELIALGRDIAEAAYGGESADLTMATVQKRLERLLSSQAGAAISFADAVQAAETTITANRDRYQRGGLIGAPTGIPSLDRLTGGFCGPRLIVIGARPGVGKTAMLNQFALTAAMRDWPGLICSLEMGADELVIRALASHSGGNMTRIMRGQDPDTNHAYEAAARIGDVPLWLDTETIMLEAICAQIAAHKLRHGITWAAVDHIGLVRTEARHNSRNDQMGEISRSLKQLAKRLNIPVIALSQLSRQSAKDGRRPREDDLRDSGNIEQDADTIILLHSPDEAQEAVTRRRVEIGVVKNRGGPKAWLAAPIEFDGPTQTFREIINQEHYE